MVLPLCALHQADRWMDDGYNYQVSTTRAPGAIMLEVSRVLKAGRMSPIVGRRAFLAEEEPVLGAILGSEGPARTLLVDRVIQGGPIALTDILQEVSCEADLG